MGSLEVVVEPWIDSLLRKLSHIFGLPPIPEEKPLDPVISKKLTVSTPESDLVELVNNRLTLTSATNEVVENGSVSKSDGSLDAGDGFPSVGTEFVNEHVDSQITLTPLPG